jgi:hypothetical protein
MGVNSLAIGFDAGIRENYRLEKLITDNIIQYTGIVLITGFIIPVSENTLSVLLGCKCPKDV